VYAFGLVLYETLTGRPLHVLDRGSPLGPDGDPALRELFERVLAREPGERHPSAGAVLDEARAALGDRAPSGTSAPGSIAGELLLSGSTRGAKPSGATKGGRRTWWPAMAGVPVLVAALAWVGWSLWPAPAPGVHPARTPAAGPAQLTVCARRLTVRRDPRTASETRIVATLAPGDRFVVEGSRGRGWVYGHSSGSTTATGWALHQSVAASAMYVTGARSGAGQELDRLWYRLEALAEQGFVVVRAVLGGAGHGDELGHAAPAVSGGRGGERGVRLPEIVQRPGDHVRTRVVLQQERDEAEQAAHGLPYVRGVGRAGAGTSLGRQAGPRRGDPRLDGGGRPQRPGGELLVGDRQLNEQSSKE
jgi:hypothetical protein